MANILPMIRVGDKTSHGGTVVEGYPDGQTNVYGMSAAGLGHRVTCPLHPGIQRIAEGERSYIVRGVPIALEGMRTTCGATLIASQTNSRVERRNVATLADIGIFVQGSAPEDGAGAGSSSAMHDYDQCFHLIDEGTGQPIANRSYRITVNGRIYEGRTDGDGRTLRVGSDAAHTARIEVFGEGI